LFCAWADGGFQAEVFHGLLAPIGAAVRPAAADALPNGIDLCFRERLVHIVYPIGATPYGPGRQERLLLLIALGPSPQAAPPPVFGPLHELGPQGIAIHVAADGEEMRVLFDGKRLEASLL
jgi:hypothetical protein